MSDYYGNMREEVFALIGQEGAHFKCVLEVGCGRGEFIFNFSSGVKEYWGVEPNTHAANEAEAKGIKVMRGSFDDCLKLLPADYFDLVVCNDVIEHMPDHDQFLSQIQILVKKGGYILTSIPNVRHLENILHLLFQKDWEYKAEGIRDITHLRFFTKKSAYRSILGAGFAVNRMQGVNRYKAKTVLGRALSYLGFLIFGLDSRFLQYVFFARKI